MSSLFVLITGFGEPYYSHKLEILRNNLERIHEHPWAAVKVVLCQYTSPTAGQYTFPDALIHKYGIQVIYEPGIVGQFMKRWARPDMIESYDYILTLLDDIELLPGIDWTKMISYYHDFEMDLVSPALSLDSKFQYHYMLHDPNQPYVCLKITNCCEYFCLFADCKRFKKYYDHLDDKNPWMWGLDLVLRKHCGIRVGILNQMIMKHWYKNASYALRPDADPVKGFAYMMEKYADTAEALAHQKPVVYYIVDA